MEQLLGKYMSRWECSAYSSTGVSFMKKLQELLEDDYENSKSIYIVDVWEI